MWTKADIIDRITMLGVEEVVSETDLEEVDDPELRELLEEVKSLIAQVYVCLENEDDV